jgi:hypothetical protein
MRHLHRRLGAGIALALATSLAVALVASSPAAAAPPGNDDFDSAVQLTALPVHETADTTEATLADDDPTCVGFDSHTVWYDLVLPEDTDVILDTFGSDYDTTLSVFTGDRGALQFVDCNDDSGSLQSRVKFSVTAGVTYHVMVGSFFDTPGGNLVLNGQVPPPPMKLTIALNSSGTVTSGGLATIQGSLTCSRPGDITVTGTLRQQIGKQVVVSSFRTTVPCTASVAWQASALGETGVFKRGAVAVVAVAEFIDGVLQQVVRVRTTGTVQLR